MRMKVYFELAWQRRYVALIERFSNIIRGQIFGHTHNDNIQIMRGITNKNIISGIVYILPQLGVFPSSNPSYRIFDLQTDNYAISNYHQYRLYLDEANKNMAVLPKWRLAYIFKEFYNVSSMEYGNIANALERMKTDKMFAADLITQMMQEGPKGVELRYSESMM